MTDRDTRATEGTSRDLAYLKLLSEQFPTRRAAYTEVINLKAILNLPCGTEHFVSDI
ncbi:MAG: fructose-bisphosphatase class III, partial [Atopobiaceae bacterium]|nr:fructose-bisphosphatase class III [Atopobiaceae bacterium]